MHSGRRLSDAAGRKRSAFARTAQILARNFLRHNVARNAASLAYYLLFTLFPLLIFISNLLGRLNLNIEYITREAAALLPGDIVDLFVSYLDHISQTSSGALMWFSLVFTIWFPMRAARGLMDDVRRAYQLQKPERPMAYAVKKFVFTVVMLIVISLTLALSTLGQSLLGRLLEWIPALEQLKISAFLLKLWHYLRFVVVAVIMLATLGALYLLPQDHRRPVRSILPGVLAALAAWLAVSVCFSFYVDNFANYSVIYGTLGAVIVLLSWLYMTAIILIMGAELNAALQAQKSTPPAH